MVDTKNHSVKRRLASQFKRPQVIGTLILALVIPFTYYMVGQQTQTRQKAATENATTTGQQLELTATYESISVISPFSGDANQNNSARVEYRKAGDSIWKKGMDLMVDRRETIGSSANPWKMQARGSILKVQANTSYEVKVIYSDPDGVNNSVTGVVTTRNENQSYGSGVTYYVSPSGDDNNPGTISQPFKTIQKAADITNPGDTVLVRGGIYSLTTYIHRSGQPNAWIDFRAYPGEDPIIKDPTTPQPRHPKAGGGDCGPKASANGKCSFGIMASFIRVSGFRMEGGDLGVRVSDYDESDTSTVTEFVIIEKNYITGMRGPIHLGGTFDKQNQVQNITLQDNELHKIGPDKSPAAIHVMSTSGGHVIRRNKVYFEYEGTDIHGADCMSGAPNFGLKTGYFRDTDIYDNYCEGSTDESIETDGTNLNIRVWNNVMTGSNLGLSIAPTAVGPVYIFRNVFYKPKTHWVDRCTAVKTGEDGTGHSYFYHNTFYLADASQCLKGSESFAPNGSGSSSKNYFIKNNILYGYSRSINLFENGDKPEMDYNIHFDENGNSDGLILKYADKSFSNFDSFVAQFGQEKNGIYGKPSFADVTKNDFNLKQGSIGIDQGGIIPGFNDSDSYWAFVGSAPDIGALESGFTGNPVPTSSVPTATPTTGQTQPTPTPTVPIGGVTEKTTTLSLSPATANRTTGSTTTTNVSINTQNTITNADVSLTFNPNLIEVLDVTLGTFLPNAKEVDKTINNATGKILYSFYTDQNNAKSGTGTLATITWRAKAAGTNILAFDQNQTIVFGTQTGNTVTTNGLTPATYTITGTTVPTATPTTAVNTPVPPTATNTPIPTVVTDPACNITSASWNLSQVDEGTLVTLRALISGANCLGKQVTFKVRENDSILEGGIDEDAATQPAPATISGSTVTTTWRAEWQNDCNGLCNDPEYYFNATLAGGNTVRSADPLLSVKRSTRSFLLKLWLPYLDKNQDLLNLLMKFKSKQTGSVTEKTVTIVPGLQNIYTGTLQSDLQPGTYDVLIKRHQFLAKKVTYTIGNDTPDLDVSDVPLIGGDVNNDNVINTLDLGKVVEEYSPQQDTTAISDLTRDKRVNALDLGIVIENYFKQGEEL